MTLPILLTDLLRLRPWTDADGEAFHNLWGDPRVIWWGHAINLDASRRILEEILAKCAAMPAGLGWWALEALDTGTTVNSAANNAVVDNTTVNNTVVGNAVLRPAPYDDTAELGYHLAHGAWGCGFATEAARAVLSHAFTALALPVVSAVVHVDNQASHRVAQRLGMRLTGPITFNDLPHLRYQLAREEALKLDWCAPAGG